MNQSRNKSAKTRIVRIDRKTYSAEVVTQGLWGDEYPVLKWVPFTKHTVKAYERLVDSDGRPNALIIEPIIKVNDEYFSGRLNFASTNRRHLNGKKLTARLEQALSDRPLLSVGMSATKKEILFDGKSRLVEDIWNGGRDDVPIRGWLHVSTLSAANIAARRLKMPVVRVGKKYYAGLINISERRKQNALQTRERMLEEMPKETPKRYVAGDTRAVRIKRKNYQAKIIKVGLWDDRYSIATWHELRKDEARTAVKRLYHPIIKVDDRYFLGHYSFQPKTNP